MAEHPGPRVPRSRYFALMSLGALGVVFGDIGTSPLYALRESFAVAEDLPVDRAAVLGIISVMLWSLLLVVSIKYLIFVVRADNHGEGGMLALTALITPRRNARASATRRLLILAGLFGTALLYGDGIITPAISVLAAVEGVEVATPALDHFVVPIAVGILVALFSIQRKGTAAVGTLFGPVMIVWFAVLGALGVMHIGDDPGVLGAINPGHAVRLFVNHPAPAFLALGAVFLVVTGSEALYADMGHFGRGPIRTGWLTIVYPALTLNYLGQGALLLDDPAAIDNPFFRMPPDWAVWPLVILATMATVIASQALISGAYSLTMQAVQLGYLPRVHIDHTSPREFGQVYVPSVNWALMVSCVAVVLAFGSSSNLAAAYGVAVTTTMVITTALLYVVMRDRWQWPKGVALAVTALFGAIDLAFFSANLLKLPAGGWFPWLVGLIVFLLMTTWSWGRAGLQSKLRRADLPIERFIGSITAHPQERVTGTGVYLFPDVGATPPALLSNLRHNGVLHETIVLVSVEIESVAAVPNARRSTVHPLGDGFFQVLLRFGFTQSPDVPQALSNIVSPEFGFDDTDATYVLGREAVLATGRSGPSLARRKVFAFMHRNSTSAAQYFNLPPHQVIEVGSQVVL